MDKQQQVQSIVNVLNALNSLTAPIANSEIYTGIKQLLNQVASAIQVEIKEESEKKNSNDKTEPPTA